MAVWLRPQDSRAAIVPSPSVSHYVLFNNNNKTFFHLFEMQSYSERRRDRKNHLLACSPNDRNCQAGSFFQLPHVGAGP